MRSFGEGHHAALERRNSVPDLVASPTAALRVAFVRFMKKVPHRRFYSLGMAVAALSSAPGAAEVRAG
jgi:hypothetical protein